MQVDALRALMPADGQTGTKRADCYPGGSHTHHDLHDCRTDWRNMCADKLRC